MAELERQILDYLIRHPQARDTIEGIADWWLLEQRMQTVETVVRRALDDLQRRGFVKRAGGPDGRSTYCLNPERLEEARAWLEQERARKARTRRRTRQDADRRS